MHPLEELQEIFESYLKQQDFSRGPEELYEPFTYMLSLGGKRMRPLLLLMSYEMNGGNAEEVLPQAFAIELFHNFTLVHDDIMDNASLRRGGLTVHKKYNSNTAILSGDVMLIYAYEYLGRNQQELFPSISSIFNHVAIQVCEGQQLDLNFETQEDVSIDDYINMIQLKTAVLLGASLKMGAILAGLNTKIQQSVYEFGKYAGTAFQLRDDILDSYSDPEKFGKQTGGDIIRNKRTILLIHALSNATAEQNEKLNYWIHERDFNPAEKVSAVLRLFNDTGALGAARRMVHTYRELALQQLESIELSYENKKLLYDFVGMLAEREV